MTDYVCISVETCLIIVLITNTSAMVHGALRNERDSANFSIGENFPISYSYKCTSVAQWISSTNSRCKYSKTKTGCCCYIIIVTTE